MIYLALEIMAYLLIALALGGAAGWLLRNLAAQRQEARRSGELSQARQRQEQWEARARGSEARSQALQSQIQDRDARLGALLEALKVQEDLLTQKDQRIAELQAGLEHAADARATALEAEVQRVQRALEKERARVAELQRERTLQLNTLRALQQQLEMSRERAAGMPAGESQGRATRAGR